MPLQILPKEGSFAQTLGTGLGAGLGEGINALAGIKMQNLRDKAYKEAFGETGANLLKALPPELQKAALQNPGSLRELSDAVEAIRSQQQGGGIQALQQEHPRQLSEGQGIQNLQQQQQPSEQQIQAAREQIRQPAGLQKQPRQLTDIQKDIFTSPHEKREARKLQLAEEENDIKKEKFLQSQNKETREFLKPYYEKAEHARRNIRDYKTIIEVTKAGNVRAGVPHQILSALGISEFNRNIETQLVEKLNARLGQNASTAFGTARVTNFLEQTYQRSQPGLFNTPEGIIALSEINIKSDEALELQEAAANSVVALNQGKIPWDVYQQINNQIGDKIKQLDDESLQIAVNYVNKNQKQSDIVAKAMKDPLKYPQVFEEGQKYEGHILKNGKWEKE